MRLIEIRKSRNRARLLGVVFAATVIGVAVLLLVFGGAAQAYAANDIPTVIANTRAWVVGILAGLATLFLTVGGLRYVLAAGDPGEVEKAKSALKAAAIGYALAILAPVLLTVLQGIVGSDPAQTTPGPPKPPPSEAAKLPGNTA
ncbi:pilin [Embleya sp. NPDC055664]